MGLFKDVKELEALASSVADTADVYLVPALNGLFAPHWREDARARARARGSETCGGPSPAAT